MITNGEVTVNRRRRVGDFEHNDAVVKLSFTMDGIEQQEEFRCQIVDEAVKLANRGLLSKPHTSSDVSVADTSSPVPAPEMTAGSPRRNSKKEPITIGATAALVLEPLATPAAIASPASEPAAAPPTLPASVTIGAPMSPPPAQEIAVPGSVVASPNAVPSPLAVPAPAAVASPSAVAPSLAAGGVSSSVDLLSNDEFRKAIVAEVQRIEKIYPGEGGLRINQIIARYVPPPGSASTMQPQHRPQFIHEIRAIS